MKVKLILCVTALFFGGAALRVRLRPLTRR
jgi:hypothetical protein